MLWYSTGFGDWDVSNGTVPNEAEILMYGGDTQHAVVPLFVDSWHLGADLKSDSNMGACGVCVMVLFCALQLLVCSEQQQKQRPRMLLLPALVCGVEEKRYTSRQGLGE